MELKDLAEVFDIKIDLETATKEDLEKYRDETFVSRKAAHEDPIITSQIMGKVTGSIKTAVKRNLKSLGVELDDNDFEGKKLEAAMDEIFAAKVTPMIGALKEKQPTDKAIEKLKLEVEKYQKDANDWKTANENLSSQIETIKSESDGKIKDFKLGLAFKEAKSKIAFSDTVDDVWQQGFETMFFKNHKLDIDGDKVIVLNSNGEKIWNSAKTEVKSLEEVLKEAVPVNKLKLNGTGNQPPRKIAPIINDGIDDGTRRIGHSERLKAQQVR